MNKDIVVHDTKVARDGREYPAIGELECPNCMSHFICYEIDQRIHKGPPPPYRIFCINCYWKFIFP